MSQNPEKPNLEEKLKDLINMSLNKAPIRYQKDNKQKPDGYKKIIATSTFLLTLGFATGVMSTKITQELNAYNKTEKDYSQVIVDNTNFEKEDKEWYDIYGMANDVLNKANDSTVDAYIYICYKKFDYNSEYMDKLFRCIQQIINSNPNKYSNGLKQIANFSSFQGYLNSKHISLYDYKKMMNRIVTLSGQEKQNHDDIIEYLDDLNHSEVR